MVNRVPWTGLALGLLALALLPGAATATHGTNAFSGSWTTNASGAAGSVDFTAVDASQGGSELAAIGGAPCAAPTTYYSGPYTDGTNTGRMVGCLSGGRLVGRYQAPAGAGGINVAFIAPNSFSGSYTADSFPNFVGTYTGTFAAHLAGDGCCPSAGTPPPSDSGPPTTPVTPVENPNEGVAWGAGVELCTSQLRSALVIKSGCAARKPVTAQEKTAARKSLRDELLVATVLCGLYSGSARTGRIFAPDTIEQALQLPTATLFRMCEGAVRLMGETLVTIKDPPDRDRRIATPPRVRAAAAGTGRCPRPISATACRAIASAAAAWSAAVERSAGFASATAQTINRYAGAVAAGTADVAVVHGAVLKLYAGQQAAAFADQAKAGAAYALALRRAGLDPRFSAKPLRRLATRSLKGSVLKAATADGVGASRKAAKRKLAKQLKRAKGTLSLLELAVYTPPIQPLVAKAQSITIPDLAAVVTALGADNAINAATQQALLRDLGVATVACRARAPAAALLEQFAQDAAALVASSVSGYLQSGARTLAGAGVPASACG